MVTSGTFPLRDSETQSTQLLPFLTTQALAKVSVVVTGLGWPGGWCVHLACSSSHL